MSSDLCQRCGVSCHAAVPLGERLLVVENLHCIFFEWDKQGKGNCTVYRDRFERAPWCMLASAAAPLSFLRKGCAYTKPGSKGRERLHVSDYDAMWPQISEAVRKRKTRTLGQLTWRKFLRDAEVREPGYRWTLDIDRATDAVRPTRRRKWWHWWG